MPSGMTKPQEEAIARAYDLLGEHFDNAVILVDWDVDNANAPMRGTKLYFKGGRIVALGLMTWGTDQILDRDRDKGQDDDLTNT